MDKIEKTKYQIKNYLKKHKMLNREVSEAYFYSGCELVFTFYNYKTQKSYLGNTKFNLWEDNVLVGKNQIQEQWEKLLNELNIMIPVNPMEYCEYGDYINLIGSDFELNQEMDNGKDDSMFYKAELVGTQYEGRNERIEKVKVGDSVLLKREPDNKYDSNAIDVHNEDGTLGYVPLDIACILAPILDNGCKYSAKIANVIPLSQRSKRSKNSIIEIEVEIKMD